MVNVALNAGPRPQSAASYCLSSNCRVVHNPDVGVQHITAGFTCTT
jgi:hypothetical protein